MSDNVPLEQAAGQTSEQVALATLTRLIRHLGEELAGFRKRALSAESRVKSLEEQAATGGLSPERSEELVRENQDLRTRLDEAQKRTTALLDRVRFLRQQHDTVNEKAHESAPAKAGTA